ncbi:EAL domain-containing protein [Celerinatantimonas yamalensis]|uniref:EAL domain-containing protein n=1 Tax=Celerinatantimonas yamalensis TaxID=559956 RepID=A0ABW9G6V1_9GAMM
MNRFRAIYLATLGIIVFALVKPAFSRDAVTLSHPSVRIGFLSNDPPMSYRDGQQAQGFLIQHIKQALQQNFSLTWIPFTSRKQGRKALTNQKIDLWLTNQTHKDWQVTRGLYQERWMLASVPGHLSNSRVVNAGNLTLAARQLPQIYRQSSQLRQHIVPVNSWLKAMSLLQSNQVDGLLLTNHQIYQLPEQGASLELRPLTLWQRYYLAARVASPAASLLPLINQQINNSFQENSLVNQSAAQGHSSVWHWEILTPAFLSLVLAGALVLLLTRYYRLRLRFEHYRQYRNSSITGLPQDLELRQQLDEWLTSLDPFGVFMFDFSRQSEIYESFGLAVGNHMRRAFAQRCRKKLLEAFPKGELYHWRDHYFVLLYPMLTPPLQGSDIAQRIAALCRGWLKLDGLKIRLRSHVGWTNVQEKVDLLYGEALLSQAYLALNHAIDKQHRVCQYLPNQQADSKARLSLEARLRRAIDSEQLFLYFQPQFTLADRRLVGAEVLVRWRDQDGNMISPGEFIPLAEQTGLIARLDHWVFERAIEMLAGWQSHLPKDFRLSVNFSAVSVSRGLCELWVMELTEKWKVDPHYICLEITESSIMSSPEQAKQSIERLRSCGFDIAIDDFGTGYSSMAYLKHLPVTHIKIDQAFTAGLEHGKADQQIVRAIVTIGKSFGHRILIEGVEGAGQAKLAEELGCQYVQGYHFAKPMGGADFIEQYLKPAANELIYQLA